MHLVFFMQKLMLKFNFPTSSLRFSSSLSFSYSNKSGSIFLKLLVLKDSDWLKGLIGFWLDLVESFELHSEKTGKFCLRLD